MAKIFKISGYYVDTNDDWSSSELQTELEERFDLIDKHIQVEEADIGEWADNNPLNMCDSLIEQCEKYFNSNVCNNTQHIKSETLCKHCKVTAICHKSRCSDNKCGRYADGCACLCVAISNGEVCDAYRPR